MNRAFCPRVANRRTVESPAGSRSLRRWVAATLLGACLIGLCFSATPLPAAAEPRAEPDPALVGGDADPGTPGMRVYVNPQTGEIEEPPASAPSRRSAAPSTAPPPAPVEVPGPTEAGGMMIDGKAFQTEMRAAVGPDGKTITGCDHAGPAVEGEQ